MKFTNLFYLAFSILFIFSCGYTKRQNVKNEVDFKKKSGMVQPDNSLSAKEKEQGWVLLFDGNSLEHWRGVYEDDFPEKGWKVESDMLMVEAGTGAESGNGGDIVTKDEYKNFEFKLDFKVTEGANSGIKYYVTEQYKSDKSAIGLEYQILDDNINPDAKLGNNGGSTRTVSSLYDLIPAPSTKPIRPVGEWNHAKIVSENGKVEHWLNGEKVLVYDRFSKEFKQKIQNSKYKNWKGFGLWDSGHILLQDHGHQVYFKNIKIRKL